MVPKCLYASLLMAAAAAPVLAQANAAQTTRYGLCSGSSGQTGNVYISDVFSMAANAGFTARAAFTQYIRSVDGSVANISCGSLPTQEDAEKAKQTAQNQFQQMVAKLQTVPNSKKLQLVDTGWKYQASQTPVATPSAAFTSNPVALSAQNTTPAPPASTANPATATKSIANSTQQSMTQSVKGAESSVTNSVNSTVTGSVNTVTSDVTNGVEANIHNQLQGLQNKLAGKKTPPPAAAPATAPAASATPATVSTETPPAQVKSAALVATPTPTSSAPAPAAVSTKPSIVDEGDGKHSLLLLPGQSDAHELTLVQGSKNVYMEDSTGDKYIVLPNGDITHISHAKTAATN